jgi:hypothetical protein
MVHQRVSNLIVTRRGSSAAGIFDRRSVARRGTILVVPANEVAMIDHVPDKNHACLMPLLGLVACLLTMPGPAAAQAPPKDDAVQYHEPFKGAAQKAADFRLIGPDAKESVAFEPDGLRIVLRPGKSHDPTGVATTFGVKGDFEITVHYEVLEEPAMEDAGVALIGTRLSLTATLDWPQPSDASIRRKITPTQPAHILTYRTMRRDADSKAESRGATFPVKEKSGRLRLVRTGADIAYYLAEGENDDFTLLTTHSFSADDLKDVRLYGHTSNPKAALDVRFKDLDIRAASLPRKAVATPKPAAEKIPTKEYAESYQQSFRGKAAEVPGWMLAGPDAEDCVRFEPEGLRLTLPEGWPGERPTTGVRSLFQVKGDFEITAAYEILKQPDPADAGTPHTRVSLEAILDTPRAQTPKCDMATINRVVATRGPLFVTWTRLWDPAAGKSISGGKDHPTTAAVGRLRLLRSGANLYYLTSTGVGGDFDFRGKARFGTEDLAQIQIKAATGGPRAALDVRVTDLLVRADAIPGAPAATPAAASDPAAPPSHESRRGWLLAMLVVLTLALLGLLALYRSRAASKPVPRPASRR